MKLTRLFSEFSQYIATRQFPKQPPSCPASDVDLIHFWKILPPEAFLYNIYIYASSWKYL